MQSLLLITKVPRAGSVKTRLSPFLTPEEACGLAGAFLCDLVAALQLLARIDLILAVPDDDDPAELERLLYADPRIRPGVPLFRQGGGSLGDRLDRLITQAIRDGARTATVVGSDHPDLPGALVASCAAVAEDGRTGWIPTEDGGFAALSAPRPCPELFREVPWSTPDVAGAVRRNAEAAGTELVAVGTWQDVDTAADLFRLLADPDTETRCPRTWDVLNSLNPPAPHRRRPEGGP